MNIIGLKSVVIADLARQPVKNKARGVQNV
jgi:hypothetical protein